MKRIIVVIFCLLTIWACSHLEYQTVEIVWKNQNNTPVVKWMWVRWSDGSILTSAHVVRDGALVYEIDEMPYRVKMRDIIGDRAILSVNYTWGVINDGDRIISLFLVNRQSIKKWDSIYTEVIRSGSIIQISGKILDLNASILGYDTLGRITTLSGIVLIDIMLSPWDSGAGIFTLSGELVDVVHVK